MFKFLGYRVLFFKTSLFRIGVWGLGVTLEGLEGFNTGLRDSGFGVGKQGWPTLSGFRIWGGSRFSSFSRHRGFCDLCPKLPYFVG